MLPGTVVPDRDVRRIGLRAALTALAVPFLLAGCNLTTEPSPFGEGGHLVSGGPPPDGIVALNNPPRTSASGTPSTVLSDQEHVVGVFRNGSAMAYPVKVLDWREVANDVVGGESVVISYCPLTATAIGFTSRISAGSARFGVSGLLCDNNLVMFDRITQSLWPQMAWSSVRGPLEGEVLRQIPVIETDWETWKSMHPDTEVLDIADMEASSAYDYDLYPYGNYYTGEGVFFPLRRRDSRLSNKARVHGVRLGEARRVYRIEDFGAGMAVNDTLGGSPIVVLGSRTRDFAAAFRRTVNGSARTFQYVGSTPATMTDEETGTVWDVHGLAISGPDAGERLQPVTGFTGFWFAWASFEPDIEIWAPPVPR